MHPAHYRGAHQTGKNQIMFQSETRVPCWNIPGCRSSRTPSYIGWRAAIIEGIRAGWNREIVWRSTRLSNHHAGFYTPRRPHG